MDAWMGTIIVIAITNFVPPPACGRGAEETARGRGLLLSKDVAGNVAGRHSSHGVEGVNPAGRTRGNGVARKVGPNVLRRRHGCRRFFVFQRPLLFGAINLAQIVEDRKSTR